MASRRRNVVERVAGAATGRVLDTIDPDLVLQYVDIDALLARVDVQLLVDRIDPNPLIERLDVQRLVERVDMDLLLASVDIEAVVRRSGIPEVVAESTQRLAKGTLDLPRRQVVGIDTLIGHGLDRILRRRYDSTALVPERFISAATRPGSAQRVTVTGHYSGPLGRLLAALLDSALIAALFTIGYAFVAAIADVFFHWTVDQHVSTPARALLAALWPFVYFFASLAIAGRTAGMGIVGMRVVCADGDPLSVRRALVRTLLMPISLAFAGLGLLPIIFQKEHRALHDLLAGTSVVIDWGDRPAELPGPLSVFITRHADT